MTSRVLSRDGIAIAVRDHAGTQRYVLKKWQRLELEEVGVYTLEGANQAGKSVLIKHLMGVLPPAVETENSKADTIIGDSAVHIGHVADALRHGLVAVFQDDELVPSMTVRQQMLMRHATPNWRNYRNIGGRWLYDRFRVDKVRQNYGVLDFLHRLEPDESSAYPATLVNVEADRHLKLYGEKFTSILDRYPRQMSGGSRAVARLVQAQLTKDIRVLFLDEAFSAVQSDIWPHLVEVLKGWAKERRISIVAVSHNQRELIQWQPKKRFLIENGEISEKGIRGYVSLQPGLPRRVDAFPVFEPPYEHSWCAPFKGPAVILADRAVAAHDALLPIRSFLVNQSIGDATPLCQASVRQSSGYHY